MFGLLNLHQLAELGGLARLALADHLGLRFKYAHDLAFGSGVATENPLLSLPYDLLD